MNRRFKRRLGMQNAVYNAAAFPRRDDGTTLADIVRAFATYADCFRRDAKAWLIALSYVSDQSPPLPPDRQTLRFTSQSTGDRMARATLSILIPCYNEAAVIDQTLDAVAAVARRLDAQGVDVEVVAVDDCSTDGTYQHLLSRRGRDGFTLVAVRHERNRGKGGAIKTGRDHCSGDLVVLQDADLELDPAEIPGVIGPILDGRADAVLGSRFLRTGERLVVNFWHRLGNKVLTYASNAFTGLDITDMETGFKAFTMSTFRLMHLTKERFGIEPEMVARIAQMRARVVEVPVSYRGRTYRDGKKITWKDGVAAFGHIISAHRSAAHQARLTPDGTSEALGIEASRARPMEAKAETPEPRRPAKAASSAEESAHVT